MPVRPIPIGRSERDVNLALLFVPHGGFTDQAAFRALCKRALKKAVTERALDPLRLVRKKIRAWSSWPALVDDIRRVEDDIFLEHPITLYNYLQANTLPGRFPFEFWVDPATRFQRGVIVVTDSVAEPLVTPHIQIDIFTSYTLEPDERHEAYGLGPFVLMSSWPFVDGSMPEYANAKNRERAIAGQIAQAIGLLLGLGPERDFGRGNFNGPELLFPNLTRLPAAPSGTTVDLSEGKWRAFRRRSIGPNGAVRQHPGDSPTIAEVNDLRSLSRRETLVLLHPGGAEPIRHIKHLSPATRIRDARLAKLAGIGTHLIEGGLTFATGIFRPAVECTMRYSGSDKELANGNIVRQLVGFCPVCRMHIARVTYGLGDYYLTAARIAKTEGIPRGSNVAKALKKFVETPEMNDMTDDHSCVEATTHRVSKFFESVIPQFLEHQKPRENWDNWAATGFGFPSRRFQSKWALAIWLSQMNMLRSVFEWVAPFAGLGAPGSLAWSGFGVIVNEVDQVRSDELGIQVVKSLTVADLADLTPGSMLQIWTNKGGFNAYDWVVRYAASGTAVAGNSTNLEEKTPLRNASFVETRVNEPGNVLEANDEAGGHSLIFLGVKDPTKPVASRTANDYLVADQNKVATMGTAASLGSWSTSGFKFWIALEWYPMDGLAEEAE